MNLQVFTLSDFFEKDLGFPAIVWEDEIIYKPPGAIEQEYLKIPFRIKLFTELYAGARWFSFYIPNSSLSVFEICKLLISRLDSFLERLPFEAEAYGKAYGEKYLGNRVYAYTRNLYIYSEKDISPEEEAQISAFCHQNGFFITFRSTEYARLTNELKNPLAFISHDSEDKQQYAKPLALALHNQLCFVWYDEFSLKVGDSLRESIEKGIKEARKCILLITPNFLKNTSWTKKEFDSIFSREMVKGERIIFPIWCGVTPEEVYEYSPSLVDTFALHWPDGSKLSEEEYNKQFNRLIFDLYVEIMKVPKH